jgi:hypothetical protein
MITVALFGFLVLPSLSHLPFISDLSGLSPTSQTLVLAFVAVALGLVLNAIQAPLYRVLEGYYWPQALQEARKVKRRDEKHQLKEELERTTGVKQALLSEKYHRYPIDDEQVVATKLGNAIRAFETYAYDHYRLDSQILWPDLIGSVRDEARTNVDAARAAVDFFVCLVYLFATLGIACVATGLTGDRDRLKLIIIGALALALTPMWYQLAVAATDSWYASVQAVVNLGRKPLAEALGLQLPDDLQQERQMWLGVDFFVGRPFDPASVAYLNKYRAKQDKEMPDRGKFDQAELRSLVRALEQLVAMLDGDRMGRPTAAEPRPTGPDDVNPKGSMGDT